MAPPTTSPDAKRLGEQNLNAYEKWFCAHQHLSVPAFFAFPICLCFVWPCRTLSFTPGTCLTAADCVWAVLVNHGATWGRNYLLIFLPVEWCLWGNCFESGPGMHTAPAVGTRTLPSWGCPAHPSASQQLSVLGSPALSSFDKPEESMHFKLKAWTKTGIFPTWAVEAARGVKLCFYSFMLKRFGDGSFWKEDAAQTCRENRKGHKAGPGSGTWVGVCCW